MKSAIAKSQKTGKPLKVKPDSEKKLTASYGRSTNFTKIIAVICVLAMILSVCVAFSVFSQNTIKLTVYNWGEYISDGSDDSYDTNA